MVAKACNRCKAAEQTRDSSRLDGDVRFDRGIMQHSDAGNPCGQLERAFYLSISAGAMGPDFVIAQASYKAADR